MLHLYARSWHTRRCTRLFWVYTALFLTNLVLLWVYTAIFLTYVGLFWNPCCALFNVCSDILSVRKALLYRPLLSIYRALLSVDTALLSVDSWASTGLFWVYTGLFWACTGLFWVCSWCCMGFVYAQKSPVYTEKSPVHAQTSPVHAQKSHFVWRCVYVLVCMGLRARGRGILTDLSCPGKIKEFFFFDCQWTCEYATRPRTRNPHIRTDNCVIWKKARTVSVRKRDKER